MSREITFQKSVTKKNHLTPENPEIAVVAFVYNGGEGSFMALPLVRETMRAYFELQTQRESGIIDPAVTSEEDIDLSVEATPIPNQQ